MIPLSVGVSGLGKTGLARKQQWVFFLRSCQEWHGGEEWPVAQPCCKLEVAPLPLSLSHNSGMNSLLLKVHDPRPSLRKHRKELLHQLKS